MSAAHDLIRAVEKARRALGLCRCGRQVNKRGKTCCQMCWVGYGRTSHSILCQKRNRAPK